MAAAQQNRPLLMPWWALSFVFYLLSMSCLLCPHHKDTWSIFLLHAELSQVHIKDSMPVSVVLRLCQYNKILLLSP